MRDPTLNDDELQTRWTNLRDSSSTKHIPLSGTFRKNLKKEKVIGYFFCSGLDNRYLTTLACQAMFVQRIPKDLEILITRKSDKFVILDKKNNEIQLIKLIFQR